MFRYWTTAIRQLLILVLVLGLAYPLLVTGVAQAVFPSQASGSLVTVRGKTVGSRLIGQSFSSARYFWPRPSAAGNGYDPNASGASNLAPSSKKLIDGIKALVATDTLEDPGLKPGQVPVDMVTASASGLDPDISVANALAQARRVARARGLSDDQTRSLIAGHTEGRVFGLLGEPRVNVLELNLALDAIAPRAVVSDARRMP